MAGRYAKLSKNWFLRGWSDSATTIANCVTGEVRPLLTAGFYTARSCDGTTNFDSVAFLPEHRALLDAMIIEGIAQPCAPGDAIAPHQQYRYASNLCITGVHWCITNRCNLRCRHCCMKSPASKDADRSLEDMSRLIEQFERANVLQVSLTGGEPFVRNDFLVIASLLANKKIWINHIFSNGLLINGEILQELKKLDLQPSFQISFDGLGTHDLLRGTAGVESRTIAAIERVRAAGFMVIVATSTDQTNIGRLLATYDLLKRLDIQAWRIGAPMKIGNWRETATAISQDEEAKALEQLLERWLEDGKPFGVQLSGLYRGLPQCAEASWERRFHRRPGQNYPMYTPDSYDCASIRERCSLLPDGTIVPCPAYVDSSLQERMPNLFRDELSAVWTKSSLREILDTRKRVVLANNPECADCELFSYCGAGCRGSTLAETGNRLAKNPIVCDAWKKGYKRRFAEIASRWEMS